jgi:phage I-like protein
MFKSMVQNFTDKVRGIDLAIDYKHDSDDIAAGWIKNLYIKNNDELRASVDWTPGGRKILSDKEFRYLSADFHLDYKSNETNQKHGPTLLGAGLTNRPFIKEMDPVLTLSETKGNQMDEKDKKIAELEAQIAALKKAADEDKAQDAAGTEGTELDDMKKQNADLQAKCAAYEASAAKANEEKKLAEKKAAFDKLFKEGKAVEAQRQAFMDNDAVKFAENAMPINLGGSGSSQEPPAAVAGTRAEAESQIIKLAEKHLSDKAVKDLGEGFRKVLSENPELRKKYES